MNELALRAVSVLLIFSSACVSSKGRSLGSSIEDIRQKHQVPALTVMTMKGGKIGGPAFVGIRKVGDPNQRG